MKLLASDYDDTFYVSEEGIKENIEKVKEFKKDNIFLIATGRSYEEFMEKDNIYHIPYDYLILNHGTTIIKEGKVIYLDNNYFGMSANLKVIEGLDMLSDIVHGSGE